MPNNIDKIKELVKQFYQENKKEISPNRVPISGKVFDEEELINLVGVALDGWWTESTYSKKFENALKNFLGMNFCSLCNSGSSANLLAFKALTSIKLGDRRIKKGDEVITTAVSFPTTVNPIILSGCVPVFVDVDIPTYNVKIEEIKKAITNKTKAVFLAHTLGNPFQVEEIKQLCKEHNLWLIEDNCIEGDRCSVIRVDGEVQVLTIKEIYQLFKLNNYHKLEVLSHGKIIVEDDIYNLSDEFLNTLSRRQFEIIEAYKKYCGNTDKIIAKVGISRASYYCSVWEIRKKMKEFTVVKCKWSLVEKVIFKGKKKVLNITQNFGQTCVTEDHRLMHFQGVQLRDKKVINFFDNNDRFVNILATDNSKNIELDLSKYFGGYSQNNGSIQYDENWLWFEYKKKYWKGSLSELPKIKRFYKGKDLEALCSLFGFYCSEGSCGHEVRMSSTHIDEIDSAIKCMKSISNLKKIRVSRQESRKNGYIRGNKVFSKSTTYSLNMGHELINILFSILGGTDSHKKMVPNFIFNLDNKYKKIFYDYYINGDGCRKSDNDQDFVVTTASLKMASGINLLNNLLFKKFSRIVITKGKYYDISPVKCLRAIKRKINRINYIDTEAEVYDIVVQGTSSFVDACGNILLHNCDALGSKYNGKYTGTFGDLSCLSFYPAHHITTAEGGAVLTNNPELYKIVQSIRDWGRDCWCGTGCDDTCKRRFKWQLGNLPYGYDHKYTYSEIGYNLKTTDLQSAIGLAQMSKLPGFIEKRKQNFNYLSEKLKDLDNHFILPKAQSKSEPSWFGFPITIKNSKINRQELMEYLNNKGVATRLLFAGNITKQPYFVDYKIEHRKVGDLENADIIMNNTFWVGLYPALTQEHLDYVQEQLRKYANSISN